MDASAVRARAGDLPREPGVYQFHESRGEESVVLYVGKAVDIRDRVRSYADPRGERIRRMVERADRIDVAVTDTETQALLLEANLIKRHQPRYNVRLKDDKSYPMVQLTAHEFPRIETTRDPDEAATVYGPFTDVGRVETVVKALRETYGVRGCSDHKFSNRDRPCLDHDIGLCTAPCTGEIGEGAYLADVESVQRFFEGETGVLADPLRREMEAAAQATEYERAANLRDRLEAVEAFHGGGGEAVVASDERTVDVLGVAIAGDDATVARLHSEDGKLVDRERHSMTVPDGQPSGARLPNERAATAEPRAARSEQSEDREGSERGAERSASRVAEQSDAPAESERGAERPASGETASHDADGASRVAEVLAAFVTQYYAERRLPDALLLSERLADREVEAWLEAEGVAVRVPGAGREATLVDLALKNARSNVGRSDEAGALAAELGLDRIERIEGFDVSHAQGKAVVGSDVTFVGGAPEKRDYRRKKLPDRNDDYANMRSLVEWRARRSVEGRDDRPDPDLLLVDGGRGQLDAARDALREVGWEVPVVALAKEEETVFTPGRSFDWPDDAPQLHLLQRVRDEAHRFAVQYHQTVRDDVSTALDEVPGVGPELRRRLLRRFGSVEGVRGASTAELRAVEGVGPATAETLRQQLN